MTTLSACVYIFWAINLVLASIAVFGGKMNSRRIFMAGFVCLVGLGLFVIWGLWKARPYSLEESSYSVTVPDGRSSLVVGSSPEADIVLPSINVAGLHAKLIRRTSSDGRGGSLWAVNLSKSSKLLVKNSADTKIYEDVNSLELSVGREFKVAGETYRVSSLGNPVTFEATDAQGNNSTFQSSVQGIKARLKYFIVSHFPIGSPEAVFKDYSDPTRTFSNYAEVYCKDRKFYLRGKEDEREDKNLIWYTDPGTGMPVCLADRAVEIKLHEGVSVDDCMILGFTKFRVGMMPLDGGTRFRLTVTGNGEKRFIFKDDTAGAGAPPVVARLNGHSGETASIGLAYDAGGVKLAYNTTRTDPDGAVVIGAGTTERAGPSLLKPGMTLRAYFGGGAGSADLKLGHTYDDGIFKKTAGAVILLFMYMAVWLYSGRHWINGFNASFALLAFTLIIIGMITAFDQGAYIGDRSSAVQAGKQMGYMVVFFALVLCLGIGGCFILPWARQGNWLLRGVFRFYSRVWSFLKYSAFIDFSEAPRPDTGMITGIVRAGIIIILAGFLFLQLMHGEGGVNASFGSFQPVEALKFFMVLFVSYELHRRKINRQLVWTRIDVSRGLARVLRELVYEVVANIFGNTWMFIVAVVLSVLVGLVLVNSDYSPLLIFTLFWLNVLLFSLYNRGTNAFVLTVPFIFTSGAAIVLYYFTTRHWWVALPVLAVIAVIWARFGRKQTFLWSGLFITVALVFVAILFKASGSDNLLETKLARFPVWWDLWNNSARGGQILQGLWNIKAGGWFGTPLGSYAGEAVMPEVRNDFFLSYFAFRFGYVGLSMLVFTYALFFFSAWKACSMPGFTNPGERQRRSIFIALGATMLFLQTLIVFCSVMGIIPVMGQPLPFMAANAGSSAVTFVLPLTFLIIHASSWKNR